MKKLIKKILFLNSLWILLAALWAQPAFARTDFEIIVDFDEDGICDSEFFLGPYSFCTPNARGEPDNCVEVANSDQADTDGDKIGNACDTPAPTEGPTTDDGATPTPDVDGDEGVDPADATGGCALIVPAKASTAVPFAAMLTLLLAPVWISVLKTKK
jgi:hypothetical protein